MFADKTDFANQIFQFITLTDKDWNSWLNNVRSFLENLNNNEISIKEAYNNGLKNGYYYKAWSLIFTNSHLFNELFENLYKELNPPAPEPIKKAESKKPKEPTDPAIAVFIYCILQADLHKQPKRINNKKYCFEVLNKYSLNSKTGKGTMKVKLTKEFDFIKLNNKVKIPKHLKDCKELVLPKLDTRTKEKVLFELEKLEPIKSKQNILK